MNKASKGKPVRKKDPPAQSSGKKTGDQNVLADIPEFGDLLFVVSQGGIIENGNSLASLKTGYSENELRGQSFVSLFPEFQHNTIKDWLRNPVFEKQPPIYLRMETAEGSPLYLHFSRAKHETQKDVAYLIRGIEVTAGIFPETEKSLAEEMFFKAFHSNPALMAISSFENSQYLDVNESFLRNLGYSREEIIGHTSSELQLFVDLVQSDKFLKKLRRLSKVRDFEVSIKTRDGQTRYGLFSAEVIMLQEQPCLLTIINDITEKKLAEEELELSESRYKLVLEHMSSSMAVFQAINNGEDFRIVEFNAAAEKTEHRSREEVIGKNLSECFPQAFESEFNLVLKDVFLSGKTSHEIISFTTQTGSISWRENMVYRLPGGEVVSIYEDITEKKADEEKLRISELRFRELAEMLPLMICEARLDGTITYANRFAYKNTLYTPDDVIEGMSVFDLLDKRDTALARSELMKIIKGKTDIRPREYTAIRKDGTKFPAQVFMNLIYRGNAPVGLRGVMIDNTEREKARRELELEKAYLAELIESAPEAIVMHDNHGKIVQVNSEFTRLFGYSREEAIGKVLDSLLARGKLTKEAAEITRRVASGEQVEIEAKRVRKDGSLVDVSILGTPIILDNRQVGTYGIYRDISARKKAETVQRMVNTISKTVITTKDLEDLFLVIKKELSQLMDTTNFFIALYNKEKDSISLPFFKDEKDRFQDIPAGKTITSYVIRNQRSLLLKTEDMKTLEEEGEIELVGTNCKVWMGAPLRSKKEIIGIISLQNYDDQDAYTPEDQSILEFIADQVGIAIEWKRAENELYNSLEKYRAVAETTIAGIGITDSEEKLTYVNSAFAQMLGYESDELIGKNLADITTPERFMYYREQTQKRMSGIESQYETTLIRKDGSLLETLVHASPLFDESMQFRETLAVIIDITRLKETQEELIRAKEVAEEAAKAKQQFLSTMSHEIRTPMNAVIGMTYLLLQENPRPDQAENLQSLKFSSENLLVLINDILDYSKIEAGKVVFEEADFDLHDLLKGLRQSFVFKALDKNLKLENRIDPEVPQILIGDPVRLNQILTNLMSNALKFTESGGVYLDVKLAGKNEKETRIEFSVTDTGIGIRKEKQATIFDSFVQASPDTTRKYGGTGLGLAICKQLLLLKNSDLKVESEPGKGSRFFFTLVFRNSKLTTITEKDDFGKISYEKLNGKKILLVEDNEINRVVAYKFLRKWGMIIREAMNGKEAVELIKKNRFDLVLMDLQMPVMDGYEATRLIRESIKGGKELPIIALTASIMNDVQEKIYHSGMTDLILKPFNPNELYSKIAKYLEK